MTTITERVTEALANLNKFEDLEGKFKSVIKELRVHSDSDTCQR